MFRKSFGPALALGLLIGVGMAITRSIQETRHVATRVTVRVLTGPENEAFLADPELSKVLDSAGLRISLEKADSGDISQRPDLKNFDAVFLDGEDAAAKIAQITHSKAIFTSLYTPLVVASWKSLIPVLDASGLVSRTDGLCYTLDLAKLVDLMRKGTRWKDLPQNSAYPVSKSVLISSADVRKSDSGAMYLALAAYAANGNNVVDKAASADRIADSLAGLFSRQGFQEGNSAGPFEDYAAMGIGKTPLVMIYERQFLKYVLSHANPDPGMVLLYPSPTILLKQSVVALSANGARFAQAVTSNPKIDSVAERYGFRTPDNTELFAALATKGVTIPHTVVDVIDLPRPAILEELVNQVETELSK